jgi:hypothetical protein
MVSLKKVRWLGNNLWYTERVLRGINLAEILIRQGVDQLRTT